MIYSHIRKPSGKSCSAKPCPYQVDSRVEAGELKAPSVIGLVKKPVILSGIDDIEPNQVFHSIEYITITVRNISAWLVKSSI